MLKTVSRLNLTKIFLLAILIRLLLMPFYFHPDIKTYNYQASFLKNGVVNIYTYLVNNKDLLPLKEEFVYFPLTYFFIGGYQILATPLLGPNFSSWLSDASVQAIDKIGTFRYLFILKLPYLIVDLTIAFLFIRFFQDDKQKKQAFILWLFNPFSIAIIYIFSNIDIIPVALSLLSLLLFSEGKQSHGLFQKRKLILGSFLLGSAIGFKPYPFLFLPFLLLSIRTFKKIILIISVVLITVGGIILPFFSSAFFHSALVSNLTTRIAFPGIGIGFGEALMIGVISLTVLFFVGLLSKDHHIKSCWYYLFAALLLTFSTIHYHIQWLLWIIPFIIIFHIFERNIGKLAWIWIFLACLIPLLYDDRSMSIALLSSISPVYNLLPTPFLIFQYFYDPYLIQGIIHSLMMGISLVLIWRSFKFLKT